VHAGGVRIAEGERRLEVLERVGMSVKRRGVLRSPAVTLGRAQVVSGQVQVLGNERRALTVRSPPRRQRSRDTSVEQAAPCQSRLLVDERAKLLMREGVRGLGARRLRHHAAGRQLLQRSDRLLVAAPARVAHRVQVEGPPDGSRGAKHLARHVAQSRQSPVEQALRHSGVPRSTIAGAAVVSSMMRRRSASAWLLVSPSRLTGSRTGPTTRETCRPPAHHCPNHFPRRTVSDPVP